MNMNRSTKTMEVTGSVELLHRCYCYFAVKVQMRHHPCGQAVSCVCGVAVREGNLILVADMCTNLRLHYITYNDILPDGAGIKVSANAAIFEVIQILLLMQSTVMQCRP